MFLLDQLKYLQKSLVELSYWNFVLVTLTSKYLLFIFVKSLTWIEVNIVQPIQEVVSGRSNSNQNSSNSALPDFFNAIAMTTGPYI